VACNGRSTCSIRAASLAPCRRQRILGIGVIAKRALGNAPWRFAERPLRPYCDTYGQRMQQLACEV
jgi:hypothetical protein